MLSFATRRGAPLCVLGPAGVSAILAAVVTLIGTAEFRDAPYQEWVVVSAQVREQLMFVGPVVAGATAAAIARLYRRHSMLTQGDAARSGVRQALTPIVVIATISCAGFALGLLPLLIDAYRTATTGHLAFGPVVTALVWVLFSAAVGGALGVALPQLPAVLVSVVVGFVAMNLVAWLGNGWWVVSPVLFQSPQPGQLENPTVQLYRLLFALVVGAGLVTLIHFLTVRTAIRVGGPLTVGALAVVITVGSAWPASAQLDLYTFESAVGQQCAATRSGTQICVHAAHAKDLSNALVSIEQVEANYPLDIANLVPKTILDQSLAYNLPVKDLAKTVVVGIRPGEGSTMGYQLAQILSGVMQCPVSGELTPQAQLSGDLGLWLTSQPTAFGTAADVAGEGTPDGPSITDTDSKPGPSRTIANLTDQQIHHALSASYTEVATCTMPYPQFLSLAEEG